MASKATKPSALVAESREQQKTPLQLLEEYKRQTIPRISEISFHLRKQLQEIATTINGLSELTGRNILKSEYFAKVLGEMGLVFADSEAIAKPKSRTIPPVKGSPLATKICEVLQKHGSPMDAAAVTAAIGDEGKPPTVRNYLTRLVSEGVLHRPARGQFALK